ncbi:MAG: AraC family transcriptional regulator [Clostridiaceae bacterium]|nr:AraC family transcriptional regulator [Clostridiaceae bacterium]
MNSKNQPFTHRQYMLSDNFEFFHYKDNTPLEVEYHKHDFFEIYFFISGDVTYIIEGKSYTLKPWDIILINNKELHKPVINHGAIYERIVIWVNPAFISKMSTPDSDLNMCFESTFKNKYNLLRPGTETLNIIKVILGKLNRILFADSFGAEILKELYLTELIVFLNRAYTDSDLVDIGNDVSYNSKINKIINYINQNLSEDLSLDALSSRFYSSKYHLLREFKKHTGYTPHEYITLKRLITSKELLRSGMSISDVCTECGFNNYSNFIRSFTKAFNISPKKYAKKFLP